MPIANKQWGVNNFDRRLWLSGGRETVPQGSMRRCINAAPELTGSVYSRWGSESLYSGISAISLTKFNDVRFQYDGTKLYRNGTAIATGFNGGRLSFVKMPPQIGDADYLFLTGGGRVLKIDSSGNVWNWGIAQPPNAMTAANDLWDQIVIDSLDASASNWTTTNCAVANESTIVAVGTGSLKMTPSNDTSQWAIQNDFGGTPQNWNYYTSGDFSLETDVFQLWIYYGPSNANTATWIEIDVDVNDGSFKKDWYSLGVGLVPTGSTNPVVHHVTNYNTQYQLAQWQQLTLPKSLFVRNGTSLQFDWSCVQALQIKGGIILGAVYFDNITLSGGCAMGAGPAVGVGGSEYQYYTVFHNLTTGSQSNPNDSPTNVFGNALNKVALSNIPVSGDPQVGARDLYRSSAQTESGSAFPAFYLDTIYDNSTTTYTDQISDISYPLISTPWQKSVVVPPANHASGANYFVDGGNGYYFKLTTNGTTGASVPQWVIPSSVWSPIAVFEFGDTIAPFKANGQFFKVTTAGQTGLVQPNWAAFATVGETVQDGEVVWTNIGTQTTTDNTAVWTFQGINSTQVLGNSQLLLDNPPPLSTYNDAVGPFQGLMVWCRDSVYPGRVYFSPPGRPESVEDFLDLTSGDDPTQKLVIWDENLYCITTKAVYPLIPITASDGSTQLAAGDPIQGARGTSQPFSVVATESGVVYQGPDSPRYFTNGSNGLAGFAAMAPIFRGQSEEDVAPFPATNTVIAVQTRGEILFSDTTVVLGLIAPSGTPEQEIFGVPVWRMIQQAITAFYYEDDTNVIQAAWGGNVNSLEVEGALLDLNEPIPIEWQTPSVLLNEGQSALVQRVYIDIACNGNNITPILLTDQPNAFTMPSFSNGQRGTIEINFQQPSKIFGVNLQGSINSRVELFGVSMDIRPTEP